jgi:Xaa-Pro aminopeptidase
VAITTSNRLSVLKLALQRREVDLAVIGPSSHLRYLLGYEAMAAERLTCLLVSQDSAVMIIPDFDAAEFVNTSGFRDIETWNDRHGPEGAVSSAFDRLKLRQSALIAVDDELPFRFLAALRGHFEQELLISAGEVIWPLRLVKDAEEQRRMAKAGELVSAGIDAAMEIARPGLTEVTLRRAIEAALWDVGAETIDVVLVQAGANSAAPHHKADTTPLVSGKPVLIDIAARVGGFVGDITQQVFLGQPSDDYLRAYDTVFRAQEAAVRRARAGSTADDVAVAASEVILRSEFAAWNGPSTGHGIGMDVHEPPRVVEDNQYELVAGSTITIEPGVYIPGRFGIRIEDTVLVTEGEPRRLTRGSRPLKTKST